MALYNILLIAELFLAVFVFTVLFKISAPYGKFNRKGWGKTVPAKFGWVLMESPAVFVMLFLFIYGSGWQDPAKIFFLLIWLLHYLRRTFIYPFKINSSKKAFPVLVALFGFLFNCMNGYINGFEVFTKNFYTAHWLTSPALFVGFILFLIGYRINARSDKILKHLKGKGDEEYKMPQGGLFEQVSSPHYFGEIIEWTGWMIMTWSLSGLAFVLFSIANLAPRAYKTHQWYRQKFSEYPAKRKALIPGLW